MNLPRLCFVAVTVTLLVSACGGGDDDDAAATTTAVPDPTADRPYTVTTTQRTWVDETRPTPNSPAGPEQPERTLEVWLTLPDRDDPAPLVMFAHGMAGHPEKFEELHTAWAEAGYAVAAPVFPLTSDGVEGALTNRIDVPNQPGDISFLVSRLYAASNDPEDELAGRFDQEHLGMAGLSTGGLTTYVSAVDASSHDTRFDAAMVMAAPFDEEYRTRFVAPADVPTSIYHGDSDPLVDVSEARAAFFALRPAKYLTVLLGAGHAGPFEDEGAGAEPRDPAQTEILHSTSVAFWDHHLLGLDTLDEILAAGDQPDLVEFDHELAADDVEDAGGDEAPGSTAGS